MLARLSILFLSSLLILAACSESSGDGDGESAQDSATGDDPYSFANTSASRTDGGPSDTTVTETEDVALLTEDGDDSGVGQDSSTNQSDAARVEDDAMPPTDDTATLPAGDAEPDAEPDEDVAQQGADTGQPGSDDASETDQDIVPSGPGDADATAEPGEDAASDPAPEDVGTETTVDASPALCTDLCGDADADGDVDADDLALVTDVVGGADPSSLCLADADILANGVISKADQNLLALLVEDGLEGACEPCVLACGDVNGDDVTNLIDVEYTVDTILQNNPPFIACRYWAADVNGDGTVTVTDTTLMIDHIDPQATGEGSPLACAP
jgi:hypothetical protein